MRYGNQSRLEEIIDLRIDLEIPHARHRRQIVSVSFFQDRLALRGAVRAQADTIAQMTLQSLDPSLFQPLRGKEQMNPQATSDTPHLHKKVQEIGAVGNKFGELVHNND